LLKDTFTRLMQGAEPDTEASYGVGRDGNTRPMYIDIDAQHLLLGPPMPRSDRMALVRLATSAGIGGRVVVTSSNWDGVMKGKRVHREHHRLPDVGIVPICTPEVLEEMSKGVSDLDLLVQMYEGSGLRIYRNGNLEGASPQCFLHWDGHSMRMTVPKRYEERAAAGFFEASA
jgi:hypothetical protein